MDQVSLLWLQITRLTRCQLEEPILKVKTVYIDFFDGPHKYQRWRVPEIKSTIKNLNLERMRGVDIETIRQTKEQIKLFLESLKRDPSLYSSVNQNEVLDKTRLYALSSKYGHKLSNQQLDILMYYIKPDNDGQVTSSQLIRAADRPERLEDSVTADLRDGIRSVTGSSVLSNFSDVEIPAAQLGNQYSKMGKLKQEMDKALVNGTIKEDDFRVLIQNNLPFLSRSEVDQIIQDAYSIQRIGFNDPKLAVLNNLYKKSTANQVEIANSVQISKDRNVRVKFASIQQRQQLVC